MKVTKNNYINAIAALVWAASLAGAEGNQVHTASNPAPGKADMAQAITEFRLTQMLLQDLPIPDAVAPGFSRAPKAPYVEPYHTVVLEHYAPSKRAGKGAAHFTIRHYTLSFDGCQLLIDTYRLSAPASELNISHSTKVLRSSVPYEFVEGKELKRFKTASDGMRIERFEIYKLNPENREFILSETLYPVESK